MQRRQNSFHLFLCKLSFSEWKKRYFTFPGQRLLSCMASWPTYLWCSIKNQLKTNKVQFFPYTVKIFIGRDNREKHLLLKVKLQLWNSALLQFLKNAHRRKKNPKQPNTKPVNLNIPIKLLKNSVCSWIGSELLEVNVTYPDIEMQWRIKSKRMFKEKFVMYEKIAIVLFCHYKKSKVSEKLSNEQ